jgi:hypothetical protein
MDPDQPRQAGERGGQLIKVADRPNPIEDYGVTAIGAHRNGGTVRGRSAPAFAAGGVESQTDGPEDRRSGRIIC